MIAPIVFTIIAAFVGILIGLWVADIYHDFNDKWISVEDDLPELFEYVFLCNGNSKIGFGCLSYSSQDKRVWVVYKHISVFDKNCADPNQTENNEFKVTHFKRLPKLPKL